MRNRAAGTILVASLLSVPIPSLAQPAVPPSASGRGSAPTTATPADPAAKARDRFMAGVRLAKKKDWQKAYEAFLEAWALKQHPQIALNLGRAELEIGKHGDAIEHLRYCLDENPPEHPDAALAGEWLTEVRAKVVTLKITVVGDGVEVQIDGEAIGTSPLPAEVYVEPGDHTVIARKGAAFARVTDRYEAGLTRAMQLVPKEPVVVAPPAPPTIAPPPPVPPAKAVFPVRTVTLASGGGLALVGLGIGIVGLTLASAKATERDAFCAAAADRCLTTAAEDAELYSSQKAVWTQLDNERVSFANLGITSLVIGGVAAVGTGLAFFLWKPAAPTSGTLQGLSVMPAGAGAVVKATW